MEPGKTHRTFIVAEAGINHNGDFDVAIRLVDEAKDAGADAVKFQCFWHWPDLRHLELTREEHAEIRGHCMDSGLFWFATPFSFEAIEFCADLGMGIWKIPSGLVTNHDHLRRLAAAMVDNDDMALLSTGLCTPLEIQNAIKTLSLRPEQLTVLQCTTAYPVRLEEVHLAAMPHLWPGKYGLSCHAPVPEIPVAAVAMGASVIECHLTLDRDQDGPDHKASFEPGEFRQMVSMIRNVEMALGSGEKKPTESELKIRDAVRRRMGC